MPANLENSAVATGLEKVSFHSNPKKGNAKECSNYCTIMLILQAIMIMLKILQARLQQYVNRELPRIQAGFRKGRGIRQWAANICWLIVKAREFQKNFCFIYCTKALTVWITTNCGKFLKSWEYQTTLPASWKTCVQIKKQQVELDMEQQTGWKLGKEYLKAVFVTLLI